MSESLPDLRRHVAGIGIIPAIITASLLAVVLSVITVQGWTLHAVGKSEEKGAQSRLDVDLAVLRQELHHRGADWRLGGDGRLMVDGAVADGLDKVVQDTARITHAVATVFAGDTRVATTVLRPDGSPAVGTRLAEGPARDAVIGHMNAYRGTADILGVGYFTVYEPLRDAGGNQVGILFVGVPSAKVRGVLSEIIRQTSIVALVVILIVAACIWLMLRSLLGPLKALAGAVRTIGDGRLEVSVPCASRTDQLGEIGRAVEALRQKALYARGLDKEAAANREAKARQQQAVERLSQDFGTSVVGVLAGLVASAASLRGSAAEMADAAGQTRRDMADTTSDAERSSNNLARVASAAAHLTASVNEISHQVDRAAQASREAVEQARATDGTVQELSEAANRIGHVVGLISNIAAQTNLLALNATIEAARAGEAGKGFAVVAVAVKQLASQTAQATKQIDLQIGAIQTATGRAESAVGGMTAAIERVNQVAATIATAVEQQGLATREIATQVNAVAEITQRATGAMLGVSAAAERSGQTSQTVLISAEQVRQTSGTLSDEVDRFVTAMRQSQRNESRTLNEHVTVASL